MLLTLVYVVYYSGLFALFSNLLRIQQASITAISSGGKRSISTILTTNAPAAASAPMNANKLSKNRNSIISDLQSLPEAGMR